MCLVAKNRAFWFRRSPFWTHGDPFREHFYFFVFEKCTVDVNNSGEEKFVFRKFVFDFGSLYLRVGRAQCFYVVVSAIFVSAICAHAIFVTLGSDIGFRYWDQISGSDIGMNCWDRILGSDTGSRY